MFRSTLYIVLNKPSSIIEEECGSRSIKACNSPKSVEIKNFPDEILLNIFIFLNWKDLSAMRLVCQSWRTIIDSIACVEKLKRFSSKILIESLTSPLSKLNSDSVPFYLYHAISNGVFGKNMLKNVFGSDGGIYNHWKVLESGGDGWIVEGEPAGSKPLPSHLPGRSCFVTSYGWCMKEQLITLAEHGLTATIMDQVQPQFDISEWYARRSDCGMRYRLQVSLLNSEKDVIQEFEIQTGEDLQDNEWHEISHSFKDYRPGVRYILFQHGGSDTQYWAGFYGSKMAGGSVIARIPSRFLKSDVEI